MVNGKVMTRRPGEEVQVRLGIPGIERPLVASISGLQVRAEFAAAKAADTSTYDKSDSSTYKDHYRKRQVGGKGIYASKIAARLEG